MDEHDKNLKSAIKWISLILVVVFVIIGYLIPLIKYILFHESINNDYLTVTGIGLTFMSLALAVFSVFYTSAESKKTNESFKEVHNMLVESSNVLSDIKITAESIKNKQESTVEYLKLVIKETDKKDKSDWATDYTGNKDE